MYFVEAECVVELCGPYGGGVGNVVESGLAVLEYADRTDVRSQLPTP